MTSQFDVKTMVTFGNPVLINRTNSIACELLRRTPQPECTTSVFEVDDFQEEINSGSQSEVDEGILDRQQAYLQAKKELEMDTDFPASPLSSNLDPAAIPDSSVVTTIGSASDPQMDRHEIIPIPDESWLYESQSVSSSTGVESNAEQYFVSENKDHRAVTLDTIMEEPGATLPLSQAAEKTVSKSTRGNRKAAFVRRKKAEKEAKRLAKVEQELTVITDDELISKPLERQGRKIKRNTSQRSDDASKLGQRNLRNPPSRETSHDQTHSNSFRRDTTRDLNGLDNRFYWPRLTNYPEFDYQARHMQVYNDSNPASKDQGEFTSYWHLPHSVSSGVGGSSLINLQNFAPYPTNPTEVYHYNFAGLEPRSIFRPPFSEQVLVSRMEHFIDDRQPIPLSPSNELLLESHPQSHVQSNAYRWFHEEQDEFEDNSARPADEETGVDTTSDIEIARSIDQESEASEIAQEPSNREPVSMRFPAVFMSFSPTPLRAEPARNSHDFDGESEQERFRKSKIRTFPQLMESKTMTETIVRGPPNMNFVAVFLTPYKFDFPDDELT